MSGASSATEEKYRRKTAVFRRASDALGLVLAADLLALLLLEHMDWFRALAFRKEILLALMAGVPLVFLAAFRLAAAAKRAHAVSLLAGFGLSEEEARATVREEGKSRAEGTRLQELARAYKARHKEEIDALEQEFVRLMTQVYNVRPALVRNILVVPRAGAEIRRATLWHREGKTAEDAAYALARMASEKNLRRPE